MRTAMLKLSLFALLFIAPQCAPAPKPIPPPQPSPIVPEEPSYKPEAGVPVRRSQCQRACERMVELGCLDSRVTPGGRNCEDTFCSISGRWDFACMERAKDCFAVNMCNP
jgi:hypothetical protein